MPFATSSFLLLVYKENNERGVLDIHSACFHALSKWLLQDPVDLLQITDLYTTAARLGGALEHIPNDRVTDGLDQAALLLLGEGHGRRKKIFHYSGDHLGALRRGDFKAHFVGGASGGLPKMEAYNVKR